MTRVAIIGVGLIGGSLGMALRRNRRRGKKNFWVTGFSPSQATRRQALKRGALDEAAPNLKTAVRGADVVALAVPVQMTGAVLKKIAPHLKKGAVVTDAGSVKVSVLAEAKTNLKKRKDVSFVGGHPLSGSEKTGVKNASARLFSGAPCVLTRDGAPQKAIKKISQLWSAAGSTVYVLPAKKHDAVLAATSHLPHLIAFSLFDRVAGPGMKSLHLTGGGFRDVTRIAGSDPVLWSGIISLNRKAILSELALLSQKAKKLASLPVGRMKSALVKTSRTKRRSA